MVRFYTWMQAPLVCAGFALALSGCSGARSWFGDDRPDAPYAGAYEPEYREVPAPEPTAAARPFPTLPPPKRRTEASVLRLTRPVVPAPVVTIAGMGEDDVRRVLGEPQEKNERDGRRIWTYRGAGCRVEVTFFRDVTRDTWSALAHKVVRAEGSDAAVPCSREVRPAAG